jgi:hypothetical protein
MYKLMIQTHRWQLQVRDITEPWVRNELKPNIVKYLNNVYEYQEVLIQIYYLLARKKMVLVY